MFLKSQIPITILYSIFAILSYTLQAFTINKLINLGYTSSYASDSVLFTKFVDSLILTMVIISFYNFIFSSNLESLIVSQILYLMHMISKIFQIIQFCFDLLALFGIILFIYNCAIITAYYDEFYKEIKWIYYRAAGTDPRLQQNFIIMRFSSILRAVSSIFFLKFFLIKVVYFPKFLYRDLVFFAYFLVLPAEYVFYKLRYMKKKYSIISIFLLSIVLCTVILQKFILINLFEVDIQQTSISFISLQIVFLVIDIITAIVEYRYFDQMQLVRQKRAQRPVLK
ncbi:hypothetical protein DMUE_3306 [Dictyocoela muelleri]|nr:hypothetical protein DMUE_3306 [Dictyocoela muelleri]